MKYNIASLNDDKVCLFNTSKTPNHNNVVVIPASESPHHNYTALKKAIAEYININPTQQIKLIFEPCSPTKWSVIQLY